MKRRPRGEGKGVRAVSPKTEKPATGRRINVYFHLKTGCTLEPVRGCYADLGGSKELLPVGGKGPSNTEVVPTL